MLKELQEIGLSEKEARVYLAALEIGRATAEQLAKQAKVVRPTAYVQLESLMQKGLMSRYEEGKKTYFAPESPAYLRHVFEKEQAALGAKKKGLESMLPDLVRMFEGAGERPVVRFYSGKEGIGTLREQMLEAKDKNILVLYSFDSLAAVFSEKEREEYSKRRSEKGIKARIIYNKKDGPFPDDFKLTTRHNVSEDIFKVTNDIVIFDNKVAISNLQGTLFGVLVENAQIAESLRSIFEFIWEATNNKAKSKK